MASVELPGSYGFGPGANDEPENIYVRRGFELLGPFSTGDVQALVDKGNLSLTDDACIAAPKENWKSLRAVVPTVHSAVSPNISLSQTEAGSTDEDSTDQVSKVHGAEAFEPMPKGRIARLACAREKLSAHGY